MSQAAGRPAERYGQPSPGARRLTMAAAVVAAVLFGGWVLWAALGAATRDERPVVTAFDVRSADQVVVRVSLDSRSGQPVGCSVQALDATDEVVGVADVVLRPARPSGREERVTMRTRGRAATVTIGRCAPLGPVQD